MQNGLLNPERDEFINSVLGDHSVNLLVPKKLTNPDPIVEDLISRISGKDKIKRFSADDKIYSPQDVFHLSVTESNLNRSFVIHS
jgi:hypothetical protein